MTTPHDPRKHPLQDDEIALARVLRALPAGEPSPAVDAAILAAATDAVPRRRKAGTGLRWLPGWAVGTAAAAVLAIGVGIQLRPPLVPEPPPASTSERAQALPQARPRMAVDLAEPELAPAPPPAPPPSQPQAAPRVRAPAAPAPPAPVALPERIDPPAEAAAREESAPAPFEDVSGFAPPPGSAPMGAQRAEAESATLDSIEVSGSRIRAPNTTNHAARIADAEAAEAEARAQLAAEERARRQSAAADASAQRMQAKALAPPLPPVSEDASLPPAEWLDRIRARRDQGDRPGARESLALFLRAYPDAPVPGDLVHLR